MTDDQNELMWTMILTFPVAVIVGIIIAQSMGWLPW